MTAPTRSSLLANCHYGAVGLQCTAEPMSIIHCHCHQCRRLSGAEFTTWLSLPRQATAVSGAAYLQQFAPSNEAAWHSCLDDLPKFGGTSGFERIDV